MKQRFLLAISLFLLTSACLQAQVKSSSAPSARPKLIVGLVVDQMRWDFLYRYSDRYQANGFKRLLKDGFSCEQTLIPYLPTYTAPGHASVYTGSVPAINGIVGNNWYNAELGRSVYCTEDTTVQGVGAEGKAGKMSPRNLWTTTVTDELKLATNHRSKVIGIALKDRGGILPAGHSADAAYWYDDKAGKWISSTHYMKQLPTWVEAYNKLDKPRQYMLQNWNTLYPIQTYRQSDIDDAPYEATMKGIDKPVFPYALSSIKEKDIYDAFKTTPHAMTYTFDFAQEAIRQEKMGSRNGETDFLAVSISSTDYIGHAYGPNSIEIEDTYLRLDRDLAQFFAYLDQTVGKGNYLFFLTADHGVAHVPGYLNKHKLPGAVISESNILKELNSLLEDKIGVKNAVASVTNYQVYFRVDSLDAHDKDVEDAAKYVIAHLMKKPYITHAFETKEIAETSLPRVQKDMCLNGYNAKLSGHVQFIFKAGVFEGWNNKGTTHGLWNPYDAHIPLVFMGWNVKPGKLYRETYMTDIAPTIAAMLRIQMPNGNIGKVIPELFR